VFTSNNNAIERNYSSATNCTEGTVAASGVSAYQYCCSTNLCNGNAMAKANLIVASISIIISLLLIK
jgi:hypothetical protein